MQVKPSCTPKTKNGRFFQLLTEWYHFLLQWYWSLFHIEVLVKTIPNIFLPNSLPFHFHRYSKDAFPPRLAWKWSKSAGAYRNTWSDNAWYSTADCLFYLETRWVVFQPYLFDLDIFGFDKHLLFKIFAIGNCLPRIQSIWYKLYWFSAGNAFSKFCSNPTAYYLYFLIVLRRRVAMGLEATQSATGQENCCIFWNKTCFSVLWEWCTVSTGA